MLAKFSIANGEKKNIQELFVLFLFLHLSSSPPPSLSLSRSLSISLSHIIIFRIEFNNEMPTILLLSLSFADFLRWKVVIEL